MAEQALTWDALSHDEIAALLLQAHRAPPRTATPLLDCHQWIPLARQLDWETTGGFAHAQFRCVYAPGHAPALQYWQLPLAGLPPQLRPARNLIRHLRRILPSGSLGDVYAGNNEASLIAMPAAATPLLELGARAVDHSPELVQTPQRVTIPSLRLDAVIAGVFHVSREEAQQAIEYQFLFVNFQEATKRSLRLKAGDQVVYRSKGRTEILAGELNPRSKRYWLDHLVYYA